MVAPLVATAGKLDEARGVTYRAHVGGCHDLWTIVLCENGSRSDGEQSVAARRGERASWGMVVRGISAGDRIWGPPSTGYVEDHL